jgi:hypothetical protein
MDQRLAGVSNLKRPCFVLLIMKAYILIASVCLVVLQYGCEKSNSITEASEIQSREVNLIHNIAVDGCEWHFGVDLDDEYGMWTVIPASDKLLADFIKGQSGQNGLYFIKVMIEYKHSNTEREVQCGWGTKQKMPAIELLSIQKAK